MSGLRGRGEALTKRLIESRRSARDARDRAIPRFAVGGAGGPTTVYYLAPCENKPSGGIRVIYRHVDLLAELGIPAAVVHAEPGFRCNWFENSTRVVAPADVVLGADDILVVPEFYGPGMAGLPPGVRVLVFNQGAYHTFDHIDRATTPPGAPYSGIAGLLGVLTVSDDSERLLSYAFPGVPILRARPVVDESVFHPGPEPTARRMAYMESRRGAERELLLHLLRARGLDWELAPISGMPEAEVARLLRETPVFLSFSDRDGFGLPPAEAMASACYVIGFDGGGGGEFLTPDVSSPVTTVLAFAEAVEAAAEQPLSELRVRGMRASARILERYSAAGLADDLRAVYGPLVRG
jgi:hypothetical protein